MKNTKKYVQMGPEFTHAFGRLQWVFSSQGTPCPLQTSAGRPAMPTHPFTDVARRGNGKRHVAWGEQMHGPAS